MNKYKIIIFVILFSFSVQSYAFFPLLAALFGAAETSTAVGVTVGAGEVAAAEFLMATGTRVGMKTAIESSLAVHGGIAAITFGSVAALSSQSSTSPAPLQIVLDPNKPLITPPNWTQAVLGLIQPVPPQVLNQFDKGYLFNSINYPTSQDAINAMIAITRLPANSTITITQSTYDLNYYDVNIVSPDGQRGANSSYRIVDLCPLGYTMNQNQCSLINATVIMKPSDNVCQLITQGTVITPDTRDPDCKNADLLAQGIDASDPQKLVITNPAKTDQLITRIYSDHIVEIEHLFKDNSGNTVHDKVQFDPKPTNPDASPIIGTSHTINQGTGSLEKSSTLPIAPTFDKSGLATDTGQNETNSKLQGIKDSINCIDCVNPSDTSSSDKSKVDAETKKSTDLIADQVTGQANADNEGMFSWYFSSPFPSSAACSPFTKTIHGHVITIDTCPYIAMIKAFLTWALAIYGAYDLLSLIFRKAQT